MLLDRTALLTRGADLSITKVDLPALGGHVFVRTLTGTERKELETRFQGKKVAEDLADFQGSLLALTVVDEEGRRLFTLDDVAGIMATRWDALEPLFKKALELNGFSKKDGEDLKGNPQGASGSA